MRVFCVTRRNVLEFAFGRLGVTTAHASWLAQLDCRVLVGASGSVGALIGQSACRLLACTRAAIDSTRARASGGLQSATTRALFVRGLIFTNGSRCSSIETAIHIILKTLYQVIMEYIGVVMLAVLLNGHAKWNHSCSFILRCCRALQLITKTPS